MSGRLLSKSKYMNGLQCPRLLWLIFNEPEKVPGPDASTRHIFDQGHLVGNLAKKLFPEGIQIPDDDFKGNIIRTRELLGEGRTLFEAGFMAGNLFSRLDVLKPSGENGWDIYEVKSTTSVKEENFHDVSFQRLCAAKQGLRINKCYLVFINNRYVRDGEIDPGQLFTVQEITEEVEAASAGIEGRIQSMFKTIGSPRCPPVPVGEHCGTPYDCPVTLCRDELPGNNIFSLYRGGKKCYELFHSGILHIRDIPGSFKLSRAQKIQQECEISGLPYIEREPIRSFLDVLQPPVQYLDFETINPAVPLFDGVRPYQRVPFQFSLHVIEGEAEMQHLSFLADGPEDPRPLFLGRLLESVRSEGSIGTYNRSFEDGVLRELVEAYPDRREQVEDIRGRLVDLMKPFQGFHFYHPDQNGSASIKHVLPALTGRGYEGMAVADGEAASRAFLDITCGKVSEEERRRVRADLEKYCGLDTEAMVRIMERLGELAI